MKKIISNLVYTCQDFLFHHMVVNLNGIGLFIVKAPRVPAVVMVLVFFFNDFLSRCLAPAYGRKQSFWFLSVRPKNRSSFLSVSSFSFDNLGARMLFFSFRSNKKCCVC